ncbi:phosphoglycerate kinase [Altererythrobacter sp. CC-YST694]|uniref:phosphoglycerate kinase n=1 Tax=Altererythrobacter sp. CC-YST694 TaxID=2755038 RepID=UPI001D014AB1|nr:phosphoglycerate kinase [Altererythrobacter sp. CC-YST694]MCB5424338.1 phosphoglycerate kinase [Altererythrobacter sp. CC-YST694]
MAGFKTLDDAGDVTGKVALVRVDLNLPMDGGRVTDDTRVRASAPTILELSRKGAKVLLLAHFGRPKGQRSSTQSLSMVIDAVQDVLGKEVMFVPEVAGPVVEQTVGILRNGDIAILENTRFWPGEEANDPEFAKAIAANGDLFVNDAFSAAHRAHATTEGLTHLLPSYAGRSMQAELEALEKALGNPEKPVAAVVGGAKVSSKLAVLKHLVDKVDHLIIGGGMANTFLAARGVDVGKSLCEHELAPTCEEILDAADAAGCTVHLPYDVVVAKEFAANPPSMRICNVHEVAADEMILDVGPQAVEALGDVLKTCRTLVWNGPLGAFETSPFDAATVALAKTAAALSKEGSLVSVAGGGDTVAALNHAGAAADFTYISTAGGAFLEWMEGRVLPGVAALEA